MRIAVKKYTKSYEDPISICRGDVVAWKPKDSEWAGWLWCIHPVTRKEGWVPLKYLKVLESTAEVLTNYSAVELNAEPGESLDDLYEESGWVWCRSQSGDEGWLPLEIFETR